MKEMIHIAQSALMISCMERWFAALTVVILSMLDAGNHSDKQKVPQVVQTVATAENTRFR